MGSTLTATSGAWTGGAATYAYRWLRCTPSSCTAIRGATRPSYTVVAADLGRRLAVEVTATSGSAQAMARSSGAVVAFTKRRFVKSRG